MADDKTKADTRSTHAATPATPVHAPGPKEGPRSLDKHADLNPGRQQIARERPTQDQRFEREKARGRQVAEANAERFEIAQRQRREEELETAGDAGPDAPARGFPHAPPQPIQPDMGAPVVTDAVTGGVLPKPVGASRTQGQKEQGIPSVQDAAIPSETIKGDAVQPPQPDPAHPVPPLVDTDKK